VGGCGVEHALDLFMLLRWLWFGVAVKRVLYGIGNDALWLASFGFEAMGIFGLLVYLYRHM
jgi:hypothetical protein